MTQIQMALGRRLALVGLWLGLAGLPLLFYPAVLGYDLVALGPLRGEWPAAALSFGWPVLLAGLSAALVLLVLRQAPGRAGWLWKNHWWGGAVVVGLGAYLLGCLLHKLLPASWWHWYAPDLVQPGWKPMYWWPFFSGTDKPPGWTLLPPLFSSGYALIPPVEASAIKLGALLTALLAYRRLTRTASPPPESVPSVLSV